MRIYLFRNGELKYKIGFTSRSIDKRMKEVQTGSSSELTVAGEFESEYASRIETAMHNLYSAYNTSGEWFALPEQEVVMFKERARKMHENFRFLEESGNIW